MANDATPLDTTPPKPDCTTRINTTLPLCEPYRTGSYLVFDYPPSDKTGDHFRRGDNAKLGPNKFRASGSRQLDADALTARLTQVKPRGQLHLVDLRQETHVFFNGWAVSWYADNDWANVGQPPEWTEIDEQSQLAKIAKLPVTQLFCLDPKKKEIVSPTGYATLNVTSAATEAMVAKQMEPALYVHYLRLPANDHCPPSDAMLTKFFRWWFNKFGSDDWAHFHCHGGDGRTTTFLALFDMLYWARTYGTVNFPTMKQFADRQVLLFNYQLDKTGCDPQTDWKCALATERWQLLCRVRDLIANGKVRELVAE